ncbi:uncharacterized protein LOC107272547 isoform X2 [Cephus cinctus]|uniref:Uncharacterized protein LOC107272547 isoform X2 n=1 Tax=Cephus cinctus TaxID=211228 RepID=A0AAJ7W6F3_CEPCN|nr:uncharacterized protein LOC107272547 isoform X2 [Cephus cinctus]
MWLSSGWMALVAIWTILATVLGQQDIFRNSSKYLEPQDVFATLNINQVQEKSSSVDIYGKVEDVGSASRVAKENVKFRKMDSVKNSEVNLKLKTEGNDSEKFAPETPKKDSYSLANVPQGFGMVVNPGEFVKRKNSLSKDTSDFKTSSINKDINVFEIERNKTVGEGEGNFIVIGKDVNFRKIQQRSSYALSRQEGNENLGKEVIKSRQHPRYASSEDRDIAMENHDFNDAIGKYQNKLKGIIEFERLSKNLKNQKRLNDIKTVPVNEKIHSNQQFHVNLFGKSDDQISLNSTEKFVISSVKDLKSRRNMEKRMEILDESKNYEINVNTTIRPTSNTKENVIEVSSRPGITKSSWSILSMGDMKNLTASSTPVDPKIHTPTVGLKMQFKVRNEIFQKMKNLSEQGSRGLENRRIDYDTDDDYIADVTTRLSNESLANENNAEMPAERKINIDADVQEKSHVGKDTENNTVRQRIIDSNGTAGSISKNDRIAVEQKKLNVFTAMDSTRSKMNFHKRFKPNLVDNSEIGQLGKIPSEYNLMRNLNLKNVENSEEYDIARRKVIRKNTRTLETVKPYEGNSYLESSSNGRYPRNKKITKVHMKSDTGNAFPYPYGESVLVENPFFKKFSNSKKHFSETTLPAKVLSDDKDVVSLRNMKASTKINVANVTFPAKMSGTSISREIQSLSNIVGQKSDNRGFRETTWTDYSREIETTKYSRKNRKLTESPYDLGRPISLIRESINDKDNIGKYKEKIKESEASIHQQKELQNIASYGGSNNSENSSDFSLKSPTPAASERTRMSLLFPRNILAEKHQGLGSSTRRGNKQSESVSITSMKTSGVEKNFLFGTPKFNDHGTRIGSDPGTIIHDTRSHETNSHDAISAAVSYKGNEKAPIISSDLHGTPGMMKTDADHGKIKILENSHTGTNSIGIPVGNKLVEAYSNAKKISDWIEENPQSIRSNEKENTFEENVTSSITDANTESVRTRILNFLIKNQTYLPNNDERILFNETSNKNIYFKTKGKILFNDDIYDKKRIGNLRTSIPKDIKSEINYVIRTMKNDKDRFVKRNEFSEGTDIKEYKKVDTGCQTGSEESLGPYYNINKSRLSAIDSKNDEIGADGCLIKRTTRKLGTTLHSPGGKIDENIILRKLLSDSMSTTPKTNAFAVTEKISIKNNISKKSNETPISLGKLINEDNFLLKLMNDGRTSEYRGTSNTQNVPFDALSPNLEKFNRNNRNFLSPRKRNSLNLRETHESLDNKEELGRPNTTIRSVIKSNDKKNYELDTSYKTSMTPSSKEIYDDINNANLKKRTIKNVTSLIMNEYPISNKYNSTDSSYTAEWTESLNNLKTDSTTINILETSIGIFASNKDASLRSSEQDLYDSLGSNQTLSTYDQIESDNSTRVSSTLNQWPVKHSVVVEGDLVLGGLMMVHEREDSVTCGPVMPQGGVQALEAMLYTLDRLNEKGIVPGVKIGAHILDDCDKDTYGLEMAVDFIKVQVPR